MVSGLRSLDGFTGWNDDSRDGKLEALAPAPSDRGIEKALRPPSGARGGGRLLLTLLLLLLTLEVLVLLVLVGDRVEGDEDEGEADGGCEAGCRRALQGPPDSHPRHRRHRVSPGGGGGGEILI